MLATCFNVHTYLDQSLVPLAERACSKTNVCKDATHTSSPCVNRNSVHRPTHNNMRALETDRHDRRVRSDHAGLVFRGRFTWHEKVPSSLCYHIVNTLHHFFIPAFFAAGFSRSFPAPNKHAEGDLLFLSSPAKPGFSAPL